MIPNKMINSQCSPRTKRDESTNAAQTMHKDVKDTLESILAKESNNVINEFTARSVYKKKLK